MERLRTITTHRIGMRHLSRFLPSDFDGVLCIPAPCSSALSITTIDFTVVMGSWAPADRGKGLFAPSGIWKYTVYNNSPVRQWR